MFKLSNTFANPSHGANAQRGFPAPGAGAQTTGDPSMPPGMGYPMSYAPARPTKGRRTWLDALAGIQRGFPAPLGGGQARGPGMADQTPWGLPLPVETPYYSRGAAAVVNNFGKVLENPIGAGVVVQNRTHASYGVSGQYTNGAIFWSSQTIPTTVNLQGLSDPAALAAVIDPIYIQAMVRTSG